MTKGLITTPERGGGRGGRRGTGRRSFLLGNVLIIFGMALFGAGVSIAATGGFVPSSSFVNSEIDGVPTRSLPSPWIPALQASATATPTSTSVADPAPPGSVAARETPAAAAAPPRAEPTPAPSHPKPAATHIRIPSVGINTDIVEVGYNVVAIAGQPVIQWQVADYAAGHHSLSANPGEGGNVVLTGHDDWRGAVFRTLEKAKIGDQVILTTAEGEVRYQIAEIHYRREVGVSLEERLATGTFLAPMPDERVTLVTCWPYGVDDHRLIVVAKPAA